MNIKFKLQESDADFLTALRITNPLQYQAVLATDEEKQMTYEELSVQLDWPLNTFKTRVHRARSKILAWRKAAEEK